MNEVNPVFEYFKDWPGDYRRPLRCASCGHVWMSESKLRLVTCPSCWRKTRNEVFTGSRDFWLRVREVDVKGFDKIVERFPELLKEVSGDD